MTSHNQAAPLKLLALFILLSGIPLAALGWLGYHVLQQDRALETERIRERLENAASLVARELDHGLSTFEGRLAPAARGETIALPADAVFLLIDADGVAQQRGVPLSYYPRVRGAPAVSPAIFADAEAHEFRDGNLMAAMTAYRGLSSSRDESVRAEALMRLARCLRKRNQTDEALAAYSGLSRLGAVRVAGSPAELVARRERIVLLNAAGRTDEAARERALLTAALLDARYRIERATFEYFSEFSTKRGQDAPITRAVDALWPVWTEEPAGRTSWSNGSDVFISVWRRTPTGTATIVASLASVTASIREPLKNLQVAAQLEDRSGRAAWGELPAGPRVTKSARETGLPWSLHVTPLDSEASGRVLNSRRNLFAAGFALMTFVVSAACYVIFRAVNRELRVARLQSDFVAAVSHEFRTPLTAMCHLTEMLEEGGATPARLPDYYRALGRESRRLHAMVETLLDFGRMDSGRRTYAFEATDAVALVDRVAQEYADRSPAAADRIEKAVPSANGDAIVVRADREALALAVRNLLDNALKYSPEPSPVCLTVAQRNGAAVVSVGDRGAGVTAQERREIFRKFTRGMAARTLNVKGTGIGLTMAAEIVKAHGGRLELESEPGLGSTFTIVLPSLKSEASRNSVEDPYC